MRNLPAAKSRQPDARRQASLGPWSFHNDQARGDARGSQTARVVLSLRRGGGSSVAGAMRAVTQSPMARPTSTRERFTVGISPDGAEVQRPLAEMTAAEVLAAMAWHTGEAERLARDKNICH